MTVNAPPRIQPFDSGTQFGDWIERNCANCWKDRREDGKVYKCQIQKALDIAYIGDGLIPLAMAKRMGWKYWDQPRYSWRCPEQEKERPPRQRKAPAIDKTPLFKPT